MTIHKHTLQVSRPQRDSNWILILKLWALSSGGGTQSEGVLGMAEFGQVSADCSAFIVSGLFVVCTLSLQVTRWSHIPQMLFTLVPCPFMFNPTATGTLQYWKS